ncbi:replication initiation and membrane attachment family protein [Carnobacterium gallinarum]|uniref:replication initiation and membrane attachment family protein n=1 Tax=Carnobacterium gallinarum TaxID=2749 RepID=UPI0005578D0F|nr:DnaD domain protein [Carnobacterium gallinarum]
MNYPWKSISPKDGFKVKQSTMLTDADQKILTFLYQPLTGATAYSLYMTLWSEVGEETYWSDGILHSELLSILNIGIPELYQARIKLEALGLLKTYLKKESDKLFLYELKSPLSVERFFNDDLLSLLLLETVGKRKYKNLRQRFTVSPIDLIEYQEVTKNFLDVFSFDEQRLEEERTLLKENTAIIGVNQEVAGIQLDTKTFDLKFFYAGLSSQYIKRSSITADIEKVMLVLHTMYGIDELEMQKLVLQACDIDTGMVDEKKLKQLVYASYHQDQKQPIEVKEVVAKDISSEQNKKQFRKNDLRHQGFSDADIALIETSEAITPFDFIASIKKQKGGYVARNEEWAVENLIRQSNLPKSVINILIHYVLVARGNPTLTQNLADSIANDWSQAKVTSPEAAIKKVKDLYRENEAKKQKREEQKASYSRPKAAQYNNGSSTNQRNRQESLPEWAKENQVVPEEKPMSEADQKAFMERIARIQNVGKEGDN